MQRPIQISKSARLSAARTVFDLFITQSCIHCAARVTSNLPICWKCHSLIGRADPEMLESLLKSHEVGRELRGFSLWEFKPGGPVQSLHQALKYGERPRYGFEVGKLIGLHLQRRGGLLPDLLMPVPLHRRRFRTRGYNQSEWIADGIGSVIQAPTDHALRRPKSTKSQTRLSRAEREQNLISAFEIDARPNREAECVGLVDDVITTGATIAEAAHTVEDAGFHVICISMALAV